MAETDASGFWARTLRGARDLWQEIAWAGSDGPSLGTTITRKDEPALLRQMQACLDGQGGEVSARQRAARLGQAYLGLDQDGRQRFLTAMARHFDPDTRALDDAIASYNDADGDDARRAARAKVHALSRPPRVDLLTQFNALPQGVKFLVDMRTDLLAFKRGDTALESLDREFQALLSSWFDIGFLEMRAIRWDSPASLLEKLIVYEAVHEIKSWDDLRNRLASDRRLFAFFHPRMPTEPLIFVEVALVNGMTGSIQELLDEAAPTVDPQAADTAIFYSISNTQKGLRGIGFGNFLIKRVVDDLRQELPNLKTFATLSPIPGFMKWASSHLEEMKKDVIGQDDKARIESALGKKLEPGALNMLFDDPNWSTDEQMAEALSTPMIRLCANYLTESASRSGAMPMPIDPVARFHLSNGARIERINWLGDTSAKGFTQSAGMMVNYRYRLQDIERNHERLMSKGAITYSSRIRNLIKS